MFYNLKKGHITSIYNTRIKVYKSDDIILLHKVQNVGGTCDEKLPYIVHSLLQSTHRKILVLEGDGWREGALDWVENMLMFEPIKLFYSVEEANNYLQRKEK